MTLKCTKVVKNMLGIGGTISVGAFCFSLASSKWNITKIHNLDYSKALNIDPQKISSVNDIEDFEQSKGCKFLFYRSQDSKNTFQSGSFDSARTVSFLSPIEKVKANASSCQEGSFVFIKGDDSTAAKKK